MISRRALIGGLAGAGALALAAAWRMGWLGPLPGVKKPPLGMTLTPEQKAAGLAMIRQVPSVDVHAHPGRSFLKGAEGLYPSIKLIGGPREREAFADLRASGLSAACFNTVSDLRLLGLGKGGIRAQREFEPGEAYADYLRQIALIQEIARRDQFLAVLAPGDISAAHDSAKTGVIMACEGGDFIETRLERVQKAYDDGVRVITIVHYHINDIGDIQTEALRHGGLTPFGAEVIGEMNRLGMIIDLAHAPFALVKKAVALTTRPVLLSHSNLISETAHHPRLISPDHARAIAETGGVIGAWPVGIGNATFADFIDQIFRLVDVVGIDHVAIGSDMDANYKPVFYNYRQLPLIPAMLLARGMAADEVAKVVGGNFIRMFKTVAAV
jgi:membrane dipeptidase